LFFYLKTYTKLIISLSMRKRITLKYLAEQLGLSISTVSKALKDDPEISQATTVRVKKLAKELKYRPNALAVSLKSNKTRNIGVVIPEILNSFFAKALLGIEREAALHDYKIITCITNETLKKEQEYLEMLSFNGVDGFIISACREAQNKKSYEHYNDILKEDVPLVMFDRVIEEVYCDKVVLDDEVAAKSAAEFLIGKQRKRIGIVSSVNRLEVGRQRYESIRATLEAHDQPAPLLKIKRREDPLDRIGDFIKEHNLDSIIGLDELSGICALNSAKKFGLDIPNEMSIIGFTDGVISQLSYPTLSTVSQHGEKMGKACAKILIDKLELRAERYLPSTKIIKSSIIERDSTI